MRKSYKHIQDELIETAFSTMKIYEKIHTWTGKNISLDKSSKEETELGNGYLLLALFPPVTIALIGAAIYDFFKGKSNNEKDLQLYFNENYENLKKYCEDFIASFETYLKKEAANAGT